MLSHDYYEPSGGCTSYEFFKGNRIEPDTMGKTGKRKSKGWSEPAWNDFTGKVWDAGDSDDAQALVDKWVERALGVLQNMWFA